MDLNRYSKSGAIVAGVIPPDQGGTAVATPAEGLLTLLNAHENPVTVIGNAIESYQGFATVEVWLWDYLLYTERPIEQLKVVNWPSACLYTTEQLTFRFRTKSLSADYVDVTQYVRVVFHDNCGTDGETG